MPLRDTLFVGNVKKEIKQLEIVRDDRSYKQQRLRMNSQALVYVLLILFVNFDCILGSATYKSIIWDPENPLFKNDCPLGKPKVVNVKAQSKINFVCPNVATLMDSTLGEVTKTNKYENLWLVHTIDAFNNCSVELDPKRSILMRCEDPTSLQFRTVIFQPHSAENHLQFKKGKSYYFISTCDGKSSSVNNTVGGHCSGTGNGGFLKIEMHVCKDADTACLENIGKPHCPKEPLPSSSAVLEPSSTLKPSSTIGKKTVSAVVLEKHPVATYLPTTVPCTTKTKCTATVMRTATVSSCILSPTIVGSVVEGSIGPKVEENKSQQRGAQQSGSESTKECNDWKIGVVVGICLLLSAVVCFIVYLFFCKKKKMKCPQYEVKVEPSHGLPNDGFKSETDADSLERGLPPLDMNEKGSLELKNGGKDVHYYNGHADMKKTPLV